MTLALSFELQQEHEALEEVFDLHAVDYVSSSRCAHCHESHYASWAQTFHRTMTQDASDEAVLAPFAGEVVEYLGWRATMTRENGAFVIRAVNPEGETTRREVLRSVGSHRYQQYLTRDGDTYLRLPWAWHVEENRWFHMNGAFLTPDPEGVASEGDYARHVVVWNDNCIFCHNVAPNPNLGPSGFASEVAELGVACEACHGPGAEHAAQNTSPLRRYLLHGTEDADPTIISPARLDAERSADVCGRCHGQRLAPDIARYMEHGDPFVPGDDLAHFSEPLWADTTLRGEAVFGERFWADGSPRLTAYEYQGWLQARCTLGGELTCTTCHGMHEGEPAGQLRPLETHEVSREDGSCGDCHDSSREHAGAGHGDIACVDCHMPRVVYGVLDAHRTHRIEVPRPGEDRPDACGLCHLDEADSFFGTEGNDTRSIGLRWLFGGDPIVRALTAHAYATGNAANADAALLSVMERDAYPAVRRLAWRSLRRRHSTLRPEDFDPMAPKEERVESVAALGLSEVRPDEAMVLELEAAAANVNIEIGE